MAKTAMEGATATATAKAVNGKRNGDVNGRRDSDAAEATTTMAMEGATATATAKAANGKRDGDVDGRRDGDDAASLEFLIPTKWVFS